MARTERSCWCGRVTKNRSKYCPEHQRQASREKQASRKVSSGWEWTRITDRIKERDGFQCTEILGDGKRCPETDGLEVDHVVALEDGGTNDDANLRTRCADHHLDKHRRQRGQRKG